MPKSCIYLPFHVMVKGIVGFVGSVALFNRGFSPSSWFYSVFDSVNTLYSLTHSLTRSLARSLTRSLARSVTDSTDI